MGEPPTLRRSGGSHGVGLVPQTLTAQEPKRAVLHIFRRVHALGRFALCLVTVFRVVRVLHISVPYLQYLGERSVGVGLSGLR